MKQFFERVLFLIYVVFSFAFLSGVIWLVGKFMGFDLFFGEHRISAQEARMNMLAADRSLYTGYAWRILGLLLAGLFGWGVFYRFLYVPAKNDRERVPFDASTGLAPVVTIETTSWLDSLAIALGNSKLTRKIAQLDFNLGVAPSRLTMVGKQLSVQSAMDVGVTPEQQIAYSGNSWKVQQQVARRNADGKAGRNPNQAMLRAEAGEFDARADLQKAKLEAVNLRLLDRKAIEVVSDPVLLPDMSLAETIDSSKPGQLVIGTSFDGTQRYTHDFFDKQFVLIGGQTRIGKTSTVAFQMVTAMLSWGWPVTVLEPDTKRDWQLGFSGYINHHSVEVDNAIAHIMMIHAEYIRRSAILKANKIANWSDAPELCPPWVVVIEELGILRDKLRMSGKLDVFDTLLLEMLKKAANTGLILLAIDQYPDKYEPAMRGAFSTKIAFYMGGPNLGQAMGSNRNHLLVNSKGCFDASVWDVDGNPVFFKAYHTAPYLGALLAKVPRQNKLELLTHDSCDAPVFSVVPPQERGRSRSKNLSFPAALGDDAGTARERFGETSSFDRSPVVDSENDVIGNAGTAIVIEGGGGANQRLTPPSLQRKFLRSLGRKDSFSLAAVNLCQGLFEIHPSLTQAQLRVELRACLQDFADRTGDKSPVSELKADSFRLYHAFSPNGQPIKVKVERPALYAVALDYWKEKGRILDGEEGEG